MWDSVILLLLLPVAYPTRPPPPPLQLKAFQEDFEAERRDRERLADEKQSAALRYEAEVTSLKLQLDRCKNELTHATTDVHRLRQQLTLKSQYEEEQYRNHLHKKVRGEGEEGRGGEERRGEGRGGEGKEKEKEKER